MAPVLYKASRNQYDSQFKEDYEMKKIYIILCLLLMVGCQQSIQKDSLVLGASFEEISQKTSLELVSQNNTSTQYRVYVKGDMGTALKYHSAFKVNEPYILTFNTDNELIDISFDEYTSTRRITDHAK